MDIDLLTSIPIFARLTRDELAALGKLLVAKEVAATQTIFWIGDAGTDFYIVQAGRVHVVEPDDEGKEITLASIGPGGFFGELSLLDGGPRTATVRTVSDTTLLTLSRGQFLEFLQQHPAAAIHVMTVQGQRQRETLRMVRKVKNLNEVVDERLTFGQRVADVLAIKMGSWGFIGLQTLVSLLWITANVAAYINPWDPYPFTLLNVALSFQAAYAGPIIMMSQNLQSTKDRIKADLDHQVNVKAHHEVMQLHAKIDELVGMIEKMGAGGRGA